jgi:hypothetical protein
VSACVTCRLRDKADKRGGEEGSIVADDTAEGVESERSLTCISTVAFGRLTPKAASRASEGGPYIIHVLGH